MCWLIVHVEVNRKSKTHPFTRFDFSVCDYRRTIVLEYSRMPTIVPGAKSTIRTNRLCIHWHFGEKSRFKGGVDLGQIVDPNEIVDPNPIKVPEKSEKHGTRKIDQSANGYNTACSIFFEFPGKASSGTGINTDKGCG